MAVPVWEVFAQSHHVANLTSNHTRYVLSLALHYGPDDLCAFVRSWRLHCPETHLVLFVYEQQLNTLPQLGVELVVLREFPATHAMNQWRFYAFAAYMDERGQHIRGVVLSDARDVLLQHNIWLNPHVHHALRNQELLFSLEGNYFGDGKSHNVLLQPDGSFPGAEYGAKLNMQWIEECFGSEVAREMQAHKSAVSCAGVTIGSRAVMGSYLREFLHVLESVASARCKAINGDQAIHNYLLWYLGRKGKLGFNAVAFGNGVSPVYTVGYGLPVSVNAMGQVLVSRGPADHFVPDLVHQYDRNAKLASALRTAYRCSEPMQITTIDSDTVR
ncbi:MAG: hypothetical protein WDW38_002102 [Sanguina aurantia]